MKDFLSFLSSKIFLKQLFYVLIFLAIVLIGVLFWLNMYTNHGQKLELDDYTNAELTVAKKQAKEKSFEIIVNDSIHIVGKPGGIILDQNPPSGAMVKEKRKIYVTTTKYSPDKILVKDLPLLYGTNYEQALTDLKSRYIFGEIKSKKYDAGQPGHILEVWYNGNLIIDSRTIKNRVEIDKGGTLEFVISKREGGKGLIPDLVCQEFSAAETMALLSKFQIGRVLEKGEITDRNTAFVVSQSPLSDGSSEMSFNSDISVTITQERPQDCQ